MHELKQSSSLENNRILIVDDNASVHETIRAILEFSPELADTTIQELETELFGESSKSPETAIQYVLHSAYQGEMAFKMVKRAMEENRPYAMAFVDMRMPPGWNGLETTQNIWKIAPQTEIVICTAYSDFSWEEMVAELGVTDQLLLLKKPFDISEIQQIALSLTRKWNRFRKLESYIHGLEKKRSELTKSEGAFTSGIC